MGSERPIDDMYYLQLYFNPFVILYRPSHGSEERKVFEVVQTLNTKYRGIEHQSSIDKL